MECLKNAFMNLALPSLVFSEPAPPVRTRISEELGFTLWDRWEVKGSSAMKLKEFLAAIRVSVYVYLSKNSRTATLPPIAELGLIVCRSLPIFAKYSVLLYFRMVYYVVITVLVVNKHAKKKVN